MFFSKKKTITNKIHAILEKTSEKSMKFIPNLSEFEDKLFKLTSNIQEINEKSSKVRKLYRYISKIRFL